MMTFKSDSQPPPLKPTASRHQPCLVSWSLIHSFPDFFNHQPHQSVSTINSTSQSGSSSFSPSLHPTHPHHQILTAASDLRSDLSSNLSNDLLTPTSIVSASPNGLPDLFTDEEERMTEVVNLLWEAQMGYVNHDIQLAIDRFTTAARLGSSAACLNLASIYLAELDSQTGETLSKPSPLQSPNHPTSTFFTPLLSSTSQPSPQPLNPLHHPITTGARWLITGLEYLLEPISTHRWSIALSGLSNSLLPSPPHSPIHSSQTNSSSLVSVTLDLTLAFDLVSLLVSLYCHGKLKPPIQVGTHPTTTDPSLWIDGASVAFRLLNHPVLLSTFESSTQSSHSPSSPPPPSPTPSQPDPQPHSGLSFAQPRSLSQDTKLTRTLVVQLAYLLALARWPFPDPPTPTSLPRSPNLSHWGQSQARQFWFSIIRVSELPGGIGTKAGDAIVDKAYQRLNALERPRAPSFILPSTRHRHRHRRHCSMLPFIPGSTAGLSPTPTPKRAEPVISKPAYLHRSITSPAHCLPRLQSTLTRPVSSHALQSASGWQPKRRGSTPSAAPSSFFLGRSHGRTLSTMTTPAVPAITIELYRPASSSGVEGRALDTPPGSASSTGLSVEERLQNALLADQQARLTEYVGWELDEEMEEEDEGSDAEDPDWHAIQHEQTRLMNTRSSRDQETVPVPVGMDPVLKALEAESRLNVEAQCGVCGVKGTNCPTCPKCGLVFCSRACRTMASTTGRHEMCTRPRRNASISDMSSMGSSAPDFEPN